MKKILFLLTAISFILYACKETITVAPKSADKQILTFKINNVTEESNTVDQTSRNIRIVVAPKTDRKALIPSITVSAKATISPATGIAQDFTNPVKYTVTAEDGTSQIYTVVVDVKMSSEKAITEFKFSGLNPEVKATITGLNIEATVPSTTDLKTLVPTIILSAGATVSPESGKAQDFTTSPVKYTVTAEDGTKQDYLVKITIAKSTEKQITEFRLAGLNPDVLGAIDQITGNITLTVPFGTNLKTLVPTIKLSTLATVSPLSGVNQDFTNPVTYTVKAEDGTTKVYKVFISIPGEDLQTLFVGNDNGDFYAINPKTGNQQWSVNVDGNPIRCNATCYKGLVIVTAVTGTFAYDVKTGEKKWGFKTGASIVGAYSSGTQWLSSSPMVSNGTVYFGSFDKKVYALDALTGTKTWEYTTGSGIKSSPTVVNNVVYVGSNDKKMYAFDAKTGAKKWEYLSKDFVGSSPAVVNNVVYGADEAGEIFALNATSGVKIWGYSTGTGIRSSPTLNTPYSFLIIGCGDGKIYAIDVKTGLLKWKYQTLSSIYSSPFTEAGSIYSGDAWMYAINVGDGTKLWNNTSVGVVNGLMVTSGVLYVCGNNKKVYCLDPDNGSGVKWVFDTSDILYSTPTMLTTYGNVFHGSISGNEQ